MTRVNVSSGVCGFQAQIEAEADDDFQVRLSIVSDCARVAKLAEPLATISALGEMRKPINESTVYLAAGTCKLHASCPVPCAIHKAIEAAAGLALAADVSIQIHND